jgi:predicted nucleic acid-binding protein
MRSRDAWVIDASVAAKWYLRDEDLLPQADRVLASIVAAGSTAPHIIRHEVANSLSAACRSGRESRTDAQQQLAHFLRSSLGTEPDPDSVIEQAAGITIDLSISINDAVYIALAQQIGLEFVTADDKLYRAVWGRLTSVRWLGDISVP